MKKTGLFAISIIIAAALSGCGKNETMQTVKPAGITVSATAAAQEKKSDSTTVKAEEEHTITITADAASVMSDNNQAHTISSEAPYAGSEKADIPANENDTAYDAVSSDDGDTASADFFAGSWTCGRAILEIKDNGSGSFTAQVTWSESASAHMIWQYPLTLEDGKLVCRGEGTMFHVECNDPQSGVVETVKYKDGSAEFIQKGNDLYWNDLNEHCADGFLFSK